MKKAIYILSFLIFLSCFSINSEIDIEQTTNIESLGEVIENFMLECMGTKTNDDTGHMNIKFNPSDSTATFYIGKSISDFSQKWNIPLREVEIDSSNIDISMSYQEFKITSIDQKSLIKYSYADEKIINHKSNRSFSIYLFNLCSLERQETFKRAFKRIIELSRA